MKLLRFPGCSSPPLPPLEFPTAPEVRALVLFRQGLAFSWAGQATEAIESWWDAIQLTNEWRLWGSVVIAAGAQMVLLGRNDAARDLADFAVMKPCPWAAEASFVRRALPLGDASFVESQPIDGAAALEVGGHPQAAACRMVTASVAAGEAGDLEAARKLAWRAIRTLVGVYASELIPEAERQGPGVIGGAERFWR